MHQMFVDHTLWVKEPGISDHGVLWLQDKVPKKVKKYEFKFQNLVIEMDGYKERVQQSWGLHEQGTKQYVVWQKLLRLQKVIKSCSKPIIGLSRQIEEAMRNLSKAQENLMRNRFNTKEIDTMKQRMAEINKLQTWEEKALSQRAKINWLRLGDGNNNYFHAHLKSKWHKSTISELIKEDGSKVTSHEEMEAEILRFYKELVGTTPTSIKKIDIVAMRNGRQLTKAQGDVLTKKIEDKEIWYKINGQTTKVLSARRGLRQGDPISPMLFVLVMEYLHRLTDKLQNNTRFQFHSRCDKIKIVELSFADDLLMFARGDSQSF
ncbi:unnamed protein product [Vicia faba]|uniref:Reverse transcriptase domain-containing protein n=1 Tax=Vicia faba TaxID=3906 RepID=A0AAV0ZMK1_VICFA|nr:unnamed protein product [Vicia faba]